MGLRSSSTVIAARFRYLLLERFVFQLGICPTRCPVVLASVMQLVEACWDVKEVARGVR